MDKANLQVMNEENQTPTLCSIPPESIARRGGCTCCVPTCNNKIRNRPDISYHKLPKEPTLRRKWSKLLKTKGLCNPGGNNYMCSDHFPGGKKTHTRTIFQLCYHRRHVLKQRKVPIVSDVSASTSCKVRAQENVKENEPESETMIMNDQQSEPVIRSLEDQLLELQTQIMMNYNKNMLMIWLKCNKNYFDWKDL